MVRPPLTANGRRLFVRCSVAACAASALLLPLAARPGPEIATAEPALGARLQAPEVPGPLRFPVVAVAHDPFALAPTPSPDGTEDEADDIALPPNAGAQAPAAVRAVVLGAEPKALLEIDGHSLVVGIGARVGAATIAGIDAGGVTLDDGERLPLEERLP